MSLRKSQLQINQGIWARVPWTPHPVRAEVINLGEPGRGKVRIRPTAMLATEDVRLSDIALDRDSLQDQLDSSRF